MSDKPSTPTGKLRRAGEPSSGSPSSPEQKRQSGSIADRLVNPPALSVDLKQRRTSISSQRSNSDDPTSPILQTSTHSFRDWQDVPTSALVQREHLVSVEEDIPVEQAFEILAQNQFTSLPIKNKKDDTFISDTFDYADLVAYLLLVLGKIQPTDESPESLEYLAKARSGRPVPVKFASRLSAKNPFITLKSTQTISDAVEILGNGVHRIAVTDPDNDQIVTGVLSQRRLIRYIWENGRQFRSLEPLFSRTLDDLSIGSKSVISVNGDKLVIEALQIMHDEKVSSVAVIDSQNNLLGNISCVDARLLTKSSQKSLLNSTCKSFLSLILSTRGLEDGKDSYPVFHVTSKTSLARTIAKLVATKAHRLWIVQPPVTGDSLVRNNSAGQLIGVVSLTDILYTLAKHAGKNDLHPHNARRERRRSSSASVQSLDKFRRSISIERPLR